MHFETYRINMISSDLHLPVLPTIIKFGTEIGRCLYESKHLDKQLLSKIQTCESCKCNAGDCIRTHNHWTCNPFPEEKETLQVEDLNIYQLYVIMHFLRHDKSELPGPTVNDEEETLLRTLYMVDGKKSSERISKKDVEDLMRSIISIACPGFSHRLNAKSWRFLETENQLDENDQRWLATGICLNKEAAPLLRKYIQPVMSEFYDKLKTVHTIDQQSHEKHLKNYKGFKLQYKFINDNQHRQENTFDYSVASMVELSKLFVPPHETKFSSFEECDISAAMTIIYNIDAFPTELRNIIGSIRAMSRNKWAHFKKKDWSEEMYKDGLNLIKQVISLLDFSSNEALESQKQAAMKRIEDWKVNYKPIIIRGGRAIHLNLKIGERDDNKMDARCHGFNGTQEKNATKNLSSTENKDGDRIKVDSATEGSIKLDLTAEREIFKDPDSFRTAVFALIDRMIESAEVDPDDIGGLDIDFVLPKLNKDELKVVDEAFPGSIRGYVDKTSNDDAEQTFNNSSDEPENVETIDPPVKTDPSQIQSGSSVYADQLNIIVSQEQLASKCEECSRKDDEIKELKRIITTKNRVELWLEEEESVVSFPETGYETMSTAGTDTSDEKEQKLQKADTVNSTEKEQEMQKDQSPGLDNSRRCLVIFAIVIDIFPIIISKLLESSGIPPTVLLDRIYKHKHFMKNLSPNDLDAWGKIQYDGYNKLDFSVMLKGITYFNLIPSPTRGWRAIPLPTETDIGDDVQRLRIFRNEIINRVSLEMSEIEFKEKYSYLKAVFGRLELYLNMSQDKKFASKMEKIATNIFQTSLSEDLTEVGLKETFVTEVGSNSFKVYVLKSLKDFLKDLKKEEEIPTIPITLTFPEISNSDLVRVKEDLRNEIDKDLVNIKIGKVKIG